VAKSTAFRRLPKNSPNFILPPFGGLPTHSGGWPVEILHLFDRALFQANSAGCFNP